MALACESYVERREEPQCRTKVLSDQMEARRVKNKAARRAARVQEKRSGFLAVEESAVKE
ncbi:hypothetical protein B0H12DRAFT_1238198 [Mycena haematopus]|nr:hypothetical protein B0H12DRAFT_1238198 [Mycena haematopus]